jgi:hydrogenase maturation factor HypF (carbamoyltransferase family)
VTLDGQVQGIGPRPAASILAVTMRGRGGVSADAMSVVLNVAATSSSRNGFVTVFRCGDAPPNAATVNFRPNAAVNNHTIAQLDASGRLCFYVSADVQVIADVIGYQ